MALASSSRSEEPMGSLRETTYHGMECELRRNDTVCEFQVTMSVDM